MTTIHLLIKGEVQGVYFRASAKEQADRLGVSGWVRNTPEGNVEIVASGKEAALQQFIAWCRRGPARANVTDVISSAHAEMSFHEFSIARH